MGDGVSIRDEVCGEALDAVPEASYEGVEVGQAFSPRGQRGDGVLEIRVEASLCGLHERFERQLVGESG
ncbi:hypothetical protein SAMN05444320_102460 [Streptoalloteichus hindustanus]|uniref:Uncharacterized protein n=1 Tax=Streptoalloteichus hindustanus TaxID=2017 RepID=A0A1M4YRV7_STRHI|nr:hypothetical protein SAMN05444320_102460 [Streptoalloteichus hindustanus]